MNGNKQAWLSIQSQWVSSLLAFFLFFLSTMALLIFLTTRYVGQQISANVQKQYPLTIAMSAGGEEFHEEDIQKIMGVEHIVGCQNETAYDVLPISFSNYVSTAAYEEESAKLRCSYRCADAIEFITSQAQMLEGRFPNPGETGVVVDADLAEHNGLQIGDEIEFELQEADISAEILGIYTLSRPITTVRQGNESMAYENVSQSRIFADRVILESLGLLDDFYTGMRFYVDEEKNLSSTVDQLNQMFPTFQFQNGDDYAEKITRDTAKMATRLTTIICSLLVVLGTAVTVIVLLYISGTWLREDRILRALGYGKRARFCRFLWRIHLLAIPGISLPSLLFVVGREPIAQLWVWYLFGRNIDERFELDTQPLLLSLYQNVNGLPAWAVLCICACMVLFTTLILYLRFSVTEKQKMQKRS